MRVGKNLGAGIALVLACGQPGLVPSPPVGQPALVGEGVEPAFVAAVFLRGEEESATRRGKYGIMRDVKRHAKSALARTLAIAGGLAAPLRSDAANDTFYPPRATCLASHTSS